MNFSRDKQILRQLASEYFNIANSDKNKQNIIAHKSINDLKAGNSRPIVLIDEIPWHEMNMNDELTLKCTDKSLRGIECQFRSTIYKWKHMPADMVIPPYFGVCKHVHFSGNGIDRQYNDDTASHDTDIKAHTYVDQIKTLDDIDKLHNQTVTYDHQSTLDRFHMISDIFGDILPVKIVGLESGYGTGCKIWDDISVYKSIDTLLFDLIDEPELMHKLAGKLTDILINNNRQFDELGLYDGDAYYNHSTSALTNDLHPDHTHVTSKDVWGRGLAQIFASVSPKMHDEFDITYQIKALKDFGLVYYGCCEPLDNRIHIVEKIPNLRKLSITPWANVDLSCEIIGGRYVVASKPNPAALTSKDLDEVAIRAELTRIVDACKRNGCSCDIVLKDITTVANKPTNLFRWEQIAMEVVNSY